LWSASDFSLPVKTVKSAPGDLYDFEGGSINVGSGYYRATIGKMIFFGELSADINGHTAFVQGTSIRSADRLTLNILFRKYEPGYRAFHGRGPFSSSSGGNISGLFANFTFEAAKHLFISAGCDLRHYPWLRYRCSAPSLAISKEIRLKYLPSEKLSIEAVYSYRSSLIDDQESDGITKQNDFIWRSFRGVIRYSPINFISFKTRIDYKITEPSGSRGMLMLHDVNFRFRNIPVSIWLRYCIFSTCDWDSRLYTYENDLLYNFSVPALSGEGNRSYILIDWKACNHIDFRIKYSLTELLYQKDTGSKTKELKLQLRMWF